MTVKMLAVAILVAALTPAHSRASAPLVVIAADAKLDQPGIYGLAKLRDALAARGFRVVKRADDEQADFTIVAGVGRDGEAARVLKPAGVPPTAAEALVVRRLAAIHGKPGLVLYSADARGLMYAALDVADRVARRSGAHDPFANVRDTAEEPFLSERGVSMYTMHRSYFESRLYDQRHWQKYFDVLAASRINTFVVIFGYENGGFMAPPYPYFFDVAEFPDVKMIGLTPAEQSRNTAAFKTMMRLAHERGISVTAAIWDHIYRGGVQTGGIPGAPAGCASPIFRPSANHGADERIGDHTKTSQVP